MNTPASRRLSCDCIPLRLIAAATLSTLPAFAANDTWDGGGANANWSNIVNWASNTNAPGASDTALFNAAIANTWGSAGTPIVIDSASQHIGGIAFDSTVGNYVIGATDGNTLFLTGGGEVRIRSTAAGAPIITISAPLVVTGDDAAYTFINDRDAGASKLILNGTISAGGSGQVVLTFSNRQSGSANEVNGVISDGTADSVNLVQQGNGIWYYNADNTYTGTTTIASGTARFTGDNSGGGAFLFTGGVSHFTGTNDYTGAFTIRGSASSNPQVNLGGSGSAAGSILGVTDIRLEEGGRLYLNNTDGNTDRVNDTASIRLQGSNSIFQLTGNASQNTAETIGSLTIGYGRSNVVLTSNNSRINTLDAASLIRATGRGSLYLDARSLGAGTSNATRFTLGAAPAASDLVGTGGTPSAPSSGVKNLAILPWIYGNDAGNGRFVTYDTNNGLRYLSSNETVATIASAAAPAPGETGDNVLLAASESGIATKTINSLMLSPSAAQAVTGAGAGHTLTISSGALALTSAQTSTLSGFDTVTFGNAEGVITTNHANGVLRIDSAINVTGNGGLTKTGAGTLVLAADNTYSGDTIVNQGVLQLGAGGTTGDIGSGDIVLNTGTTLVHNRTNALSIGSLSGGGNIQLNQATGELILTQSGSGNIVNNITGAAGSTLAFAGDGETTISTKLATAGQTIRVDSGTLNIADSRQTGANLEITGGVLNTTDGQFSMRRTDGGTQTLTISGGQFNVTGQYGLKGLNSDNWTNTSATTFVGTQTGGVFSIADIASGGFQLGNTTAGATTTYTLSGGLLSYTGNTLNGFLLNANTAGTSQTTFSFSGGKLLSSQTIAGQSGIGAKQAFVWTGGVLATAGYNATNLTSAAGVAVAASTNTLVNAGGTLAPGDIGVTGRTTIVGNYAVTSADAALHIDIAGTTSSGVFQDASGTGRYDNILISGSNRAVTLGGALYVNLLDGFDGSGSFTIISNTGSGGTITGQFNNTVADAASSGQRVVLDNGLSSYLVNYSATNVTLSAYIADNVWYGFDGSDWSESTNWSAFTPQAAGHIAKFDTNAYDIGAHAINLDTDLTLGGVIFDSADHSYEIASNSGKFITLQASPSTPAANVKLEAAAGNHRISVPLVLAGNLTAITAAGAGLTVDGLISGSSRSLTKSGAGSLTLTAANTYTAGTRVNAGTLFVNNTTGSGTGSGNVFVASGATLAGSGSIGGTTTFYGHLAPGATAGSTAVLTFNSAVTLQSGSSIGIDIHGVGARGVAYDGVDFNGGLSIAGAALTFNISTALADGTMLDIFNGSALTATFASVTATGSGGYNGAFVLNGSSTAYTAVLGAQTLTFDLSAGTLGFAASAIPEPSAWTALLGAFALSLGVLRRRSRA